VGDWGEANLPAMWSHPDSMKSITKGWNNGTEMGDVQRSISCTSTYMNILISKEN